MRPERWRKVEELYHAASEREPSQRAAFLREACQSDAELESEVESLLRQESSGDGLLGWDAASHSAPEASPQLQSGDRLGPYQIVSFIGSGGMGEVYRGIDTRLGRPVAVKISTREFSDRFEREARAISALNHPNICTLYDVGPNYLVLEFVEGETLSKIVERGPIPPEKALEYALGIVDALAAAHAKGIIHRDLKPGNIILAQNGIKVLDFGLAKLSSAKAADSSGSSDVATMTQPITGEGRIVGTLYYMSPEQVEAKDTDERSDIFAFGAVFYEMLAGRRAFEGDSNASVLASILKDQPPPISERQRDVPRALARAVKKCLEKKPDDRWQSARDLKAGLELIDLEAPPSAGGGIGIPAQAPSHRRRLWPVVAALALLISAAAGYEFWPKPQPAGRVTRFQIPLPEGAQVGGGFLIAVSPDGSKLAFTTEGEKGGIWIRDLGSLDARLLPGTNSAIGPFWSPDSKSLAYGAGNTLMRVDISGGPPQAVCESQDGVGSGFWTDDGDIVFGYGTLQQVKATGGVPQPLTELAPGEAGHTFPSLLPDGRHFLYRIIGRDRSGLYAGSLDSSPGRQPRVRIAEADSGPAFVRSGNPAGGDLFFVRDHTLLAQPFDPRAQRLTGDPIPVVQQIGIIGERAQFSVTASGVLAYRTGPGNKSQLTWMDRTGKILGTAGDAGDSPLISLSPDEKQVAIFRTENKSKTGDIYLLDLARDTETHLTTGQKVTVGFYGPVWSPDGKQLAYSSGNGIYIKNAGGATEAKLVKDLGRPVFVTDWTRDGRFLIYDEGEGGHISEVPLNGGDPITVVGPEARGWRGRISPDSHWIAYETELVYVRPYAIPGSGAAPAGPVIQISRGDAGTPMWSADGKELFFFDANFRAVSARIDESGGGFRPEAPVAFGFQINRSNPGWAVTKNAQRFLVSMPLDRGAQTPITVVTNWEAWLKPK
jgi:dipeptidyl aminopeptidase/acylaminoacyl peptidase/predicted Ser/Thr protein kinase